MQPQNADTSTWLRSWTTNKQTNMWWRLFKGLCYRSWSRKETGGGLAVGKSTWLLCFHLASSSWEKRGRRQGLNYRVPYYFCSNWCLVINSRKSRNLFPGLQDDRNQESPRASQPAWLWARPMEVMPVQHPHVVQLFLQRQNATLQRGVLNLGDWAAMLNREHSFKIALSPANIGRYGCAEEDLQNSPLQLKDQNFCYLWKY